MEKVYIHAKIIESMKVNGSRAESRVMECKYGKMDKNTRDNSKIMQKTEKEKYYLKTEVIIKANFSKTKFTVKVSLVLFRKVCMVK